MKQQIIEFLDLKENATLWHYPSQQFPVNSLVKVPANYQAIIYYQGNIIIELDQGDHQLKNQPEWNQLFKKEKRKNFFLNLFKRKRKVIEAKIYYINLVDIVKRNLNQKVKVVIKEQEGEVIFKGSYQVKLLSGQFVKEILDNQGLNNFFNNFNNQVITKAIEKVISSNPSVLSKINLGLISSKIASNLKNEVASIKLVQFKLEKIIVPEKIKKELLPKKEEKAPSERKNNSKKVKVK